MMRQCVLQLGDEMFTNGMGQTCENPTRDRKEDDHFSHLLKISLRQVVVCPFHGCFVCSCLVKRIRLCGFVIIIYCTTRLAGRALSSSLLVRRFRYRDPVATHSQKKAHTLLLHSYLCKLFKTVHSFVDHRCFCWLRLSGIFVCRDTMESARALQNMFLRLVASLFCHSVHIVSLRW
jgi:hypothetical protein